MAASIASWRAYLREPVAFLQATFIASLRAYLREPFVFLQATIIASRRAYLQEPIVFLQTTIIGAIIETLVSGAPCLPGGHSVQIFSGQCAPRSRACLSLSGSTSALCLCNLFHRKLLLLVWSGLVWFGLVWSGLVQ